MWGIVVGGLLVVFLANLAANALRERVTLVRRPDQLLLRNQQAAIRLDSLVFLLCVCGLGFAALLKSPMLFLLTGVGSVVAGWRVIRTRRAPTFVFDRSTDLLRRDEQVVCRLAAIDGVELSTEGERSVLELRYRDPEGQLHRERLHRARPRQAAELRAAIVSFLGP